MANDLDLGDLTITISTFDDKPHEAVFTLPNGSTVTRHFQHNGELKMRLGLGLGLLHASLVEAIALPYVEPEETPDAPPGDSPTVLTPPNDTPTDPDTSEPEPGIDPTFSEPTRIEITDQKQTVIRTQADPGTWGNAYVAAELDGYDYWEIHVASSTPKSATLAIGVTNTSLPLNGIPGDLAGTVAYWSSGAVRNNGSDTTGFATFGKGDKISIARDKDTGRVWFAKNGTWLGSTPAVSGSGHQGTLITSGPYYPFIALYSGSTQASFKFISSKFTYSAPSGFYPIGKTPPINSVLPVISGTATSGETLSTTNGTWSGSPTSYAYQWKDDGVAISGATASTFLLTDTQIGGVITCTVTATNAAGSTSATSAATSAVAAAARPLDGLTATGAWSMSRDLLTSFAGGTKYTTATGIDSLKDQTGNARHLAQATTANQPAVTTAGPNNRACADFDGSNDFLAGAAISNFIANNAGYMVVSFQADAIIANAIGSGFYNAGDALLAESGGYAGVYVGGSTRAGSYNYDGSQDYAQTDASVVAIDAPYVVEWRHEGGTLYVRVNGGTEFSVASGNTQSVSNVLRMGHSLTTAFFDGKIFEAATFSGANIPDATARNVLVDNMMTHVGAV